MYAVNLKGVNRYGKKGGKVYTDPYSSLMLIPTLLSMLVWVLFIPIIIYLIVRRRNTPEFITPYQALTSYLYFIIGASVITAVIGAIYLIYAGISAAYNSGDVANAINLGLTLLLIGALIGGLHLWGKLVVENKFGRQARTQKRVYLFSMLGLFSVAGLVTLPMAIYELIKYYVEDWHYWSNPSAQLAAAIVIVPLWVYYLVRVMMETKAVKQEPLGDDQSIAAEEAYPGIE